jgi:hypothetical protein
MVADARLHCGELAKATGVSADTIRHYERIGVLPNTVVFVGMHDLCRLAANALFWLVEC